MDLCIWTVWIPPRNMRHSIGVDTDNGTPHVRFNHTPNTTTRPMMDVDGGDFDSFKLNALDVLLAVRGVGH